MKDYPPPQKKKKKKKKKKSFGLLPAPRSGYATTIMVFFCLFTHLRIPRSPPKFNQFFIVDPYYPRPLHKISSQSVHNFLSNVVHRQTNKQTNQHYQKHNLLCQGGNYIQFPATQNEITAMEQEFYDIAQFPNVIGAIDGTLVFIRAPVEDEHLYVSRKRGHSINILGVCDAKLRFTYAVSKYA